MFRWPQRAVEEAFSFYNVTTKNWTRTPVDMLVAKVHEARVKFSPAQRERLQKVNLDARNFLSETCRFHAGANRFLHKRGDNLT